MFSNTRNLPMLLSLALSLGALPLVSLADKSAPVVEYQSAFDGYNTYQDPPVEDWKAANQTVHEIGGWRSYMQEAMSADKNDAKTHDHSGHSMHGGQQ